MNRRILIVATAALLLSGCANLRQQFTQNNSADRPSLKAARAALSEGSAATALGIARGVLSVEPTNVAALVQQGDAQVAMDNRNDAEKSYRDALAIQPGYVPALIGVGKLKLRDDAKAAEADFRAITAANPHDSAALTDLGVSLDLQERHKEAQALYAAALALNPDLTSARVNLALSLALSGDALKAEGMLHDAAASGIASPRVRADYAVAEVLAGHADQAETTLTADMTLDDAKASVETIAALAPAPAGVKK